MVFFFLKPKEEEGTRNLYPSCGHLIFLLTLNELSKSLRGFGIAHTRSLWTLRWFWLSKRKDGGGGIMFDRYR